MKNEPQAEKLGKAPASVGRRGPCTTSPLRNLAALKFLKKLPIPLKPCGRFYRLKIWLGKKYTD